MRIRDPFGAVLSDLRNHVRQGLSPPGTPLIVTDLAAALGVSATPVREALAYLAGEGLIDGRHGHVRGYLTWRVEPDDLADLLRLHQAQVLLALAQARADREADLPPWPAPLAEDASAEDLADFAEAIFARLVTAGGGEPLRRAHRVAADRLRLLRLREPLVLGPLVDELSNLAQACQGQAGPLAVRAYHRRRFAVLSRLAARLR